MTLLELSEPLLQYICRLNRSARKGGRFELNQVRSEIVALLETMRSQAKVDPGLKSRFERAELPLMFFVDFMVKESGLSFSREWRELAYERKELAGDEKFWDLLEETLKDPSEEATDCLTVYYSCIGLGFTGWYTGQPEYLRQKMMQISARIRAQLDADPGAQICPEAYQNVNTDRLIEPPGKSLVGIVIALLGLIVVLFVGNIYFYHQSSAELVAALQKLIASQAPAASAPAVVPAAADKPQEARP